MLAGNLWEPPEKGGASRRRLFHFNLRPGTTSFFPAALLLLAVLSACSRAPGPVFSAMDANRAAPGAFDVLKLCRFSDEEGPVYFAHSLHADLRSLDGERIACVRCHHDQATHGSPVPLSCSRCHVQHDKPYTRPAQTI